MFAVFVNVLTVLLGSALGLALKDRFTPKMGQTVLRALGLCTMGIGLSSLLGCGDTLGVILCMAFGAILGEGVDLEGAMDKLGSGLKGKLLKSGEGGHSFVQGFVDATVLFCVGAMSINGSIAAGLSGDYSILLSKSVMDGISAISFAATMGAGVPCSAVVILLYEGGLTLLAGVVGPYLGEEIIALMSGVGGAVILGIGLNLAAEPKEKIRVANLLPALFLPVGYVPLSHWLSGLMGGLLG